MPQAQISLPLAGARGEEITESTRQKCVCSRPAGIETPVTWPFRQYPNHFTDQTTLNPYKKGGSQFPVPFQYPLPLTVTKTGRYRHH